MLYVASLMILCASSSRAAAPSGGTTWARRRRGPRWRRRRRAPNSPPGGPVCWAEFERQFAEHLEALGVREGASSPSRGDRAEPFGRAALTRFAMSRARPPEDDVLSGLVTRVHLVYDGGYARTSVNVASPPRNGHQLEPTTRRPRSPHGGALTDLRIRDPAVKLIPAWLRQLRPRMAARRRDGRADRLGPDGPSGAGLRRDRGSAGPERALRDAARGRRVLAVGQLAPPLRRSERDVATLSASTVALVASASTGSAEYIALTAALTLMVGVIYISGELEDRGFALLARPARGAMGPPRPPRPAAEGVGIEQPSVATLLGAREHHRRRREPGMDHGRHRDRRAGRAVRVRALTAEVLDHRHLVSRPRPCCTSTTEAIAGDSRRLHFVSLSSVSADDLVQSSRRQRGWSPQRRAPWPRGSSRSAFDASDEIVKRRADDSDGGVSATHRGRARSGRARRREIPRRRPRERADGTADDPLPRRAVRRPAAAGPRRDRDLGRVRDDQHQCGSRSTGARSHSSSRPRSAPCSASLLIDILPGVAIGVALSFIL